ncbi:MAG: MmgE/PrpD family protein [Xanthobacteraceae bacterium]
MLSRTLSVWINSLDFNQIPPPVVADAKLRVLDILGVTAAACVTDAGEIVRNAALRLGPGDGARILGFGDRVTPSYAAMANGTMAHVHDYDDTHSLARIHISAPIVSTALALGEALGADGRAILTAIIAGSELTARLGAMAPGAFHDHGYHATGVVGAIGAALTAGKLLALSPEKMQNAIGIAASQAASIAECFSDGTWTKRLHAGWAAHCGIAAAQLADCGFTGPAKSLDGERGLFNAHLGRADHPYERVTDGLGETWLCAQSSFKPYPCGHLIHGYIEAAYLLREETGLRADEIKSMTCPIAPWVMPMVCEPRSEKVGPSTEAQAKISLFYCVAASFILNRIDLAAFVPAALDDPRIKALAAKISCAADPDAPQDQSKGWVIAETTYGRRVESVVKNGLGSVANPMSADEVRQKFRDNMKFAGLGTNADAAIEQVGRLDQASDIRRLVALCCHR